MALVPMMVVEYNNGRVPAGTREEAMRVATEAVNTFGGNREMAKAEADIVAHIKQTLNTKYGTTDWLCTANKSSVGAFCTHEGLNYSLLLRVGSFNILIWKENV